MTKPDDSVRVPTRQEMVAMVVETYHKTPRDQALIDLFDQTPHEAWMSKIAEGDAVPAWLEKARKLLSG